MTIEITLDISDRIGDLNKSNSELELSDFTISKSLIEMAHVIKYKHTDEYGMISFKTLKDRELGSNFIAEWINKFG